MAGKLLLVMALLGILSFLGREVLGQQVVRRKGLPHKPDPCTPPTGSSETICDQYCAEKDGGVYAGGCCMTEKDDSGHSAFFHSHVTRNASEDFEEASFPEGGNSGIPFCNCCERGYKCETGVSGCQCEDAKCAEYCSDAYGQGWEGCCSKDRNTCECCDNETHNFCDSEVYPGREPSHTCRRICIVGDCQPSCRVCAKDLFAEPRCEETVCKEGQICDRSGSCSDSDSDDDEQGDAKFFPGFWRSG